MSEVRGDDIFRNIIQFIIHILPHLKMGLFNIKHAESPVRQRRVPNSSRSATALKFLPGHLLFDYILKKSMYLMVVGKIGKY